MDLVFLPPVSMFIVCRLLFVVFIDCLHLVSVQEKIPVKLLYMCGPTKSQKRLGDAFQGFILLCRYFLCWIIAYMFTQEESIKKQSSCFVRENKDKVANLLVLNTADCTVLHQEKKRLHPLLHITVIISISLSKPDVVQTRI